MTKTAFKNKKTLFASKFEFKFKEETREMLHSEHGSVWWRNLDISESSSEIPWKFLHVVLELEVKVQLGWSC